MYNIYIYIHPLAWLVIWCGKNASYTIRIPLVGHQRMLPLDTFLAFAHRCLDHRNVQVKLGCVSKLLINTKSRDHPERMFFWASGDATTRSWIPVMGNCGVHSSKNYLTLRKNAADPSLNHDLLELFLAKIYKIDSHKKTLIGPTVLSMELVLIWAPYQVVSTESSGCPSHQPLEVRESLRFCLALPTETWTSATGLPSLAGSDASRAFPQKAGHLREFSAMVQSPECRSPWNWHIAW